MLVGRWLFVFGPRSLVLGLVMYCWSVVDCWWLLSVVDGCLQMVVDSVWLVVFVCVFGGCLVVRLSVVVACWLVVVICWLLVVGRG